MSAEDVASAVSLMLEPRGLRWALTVPASAAIEPFQKVFFISFVGCCLLVSLHDFVRLHANLQVASMVGISSLTCITTYIHHTYILPLMEYVQ